MKVNDIFKEIEKLSKEEFAELLTLLKNKEKFKSSLNEIFRKYDKSLSKLKD